MALGAVVILTGCAALSGSGEDGEAGVKGGGASPSVSGAVSPVPSYSKAQDWNEPERWSVLPGGQRTDDRGSQIGFPHTPEGAVAMMAAGNTTSVEADTSAVDEQLRIYRSYLAGADQSPRAAGQVESEAKAVDKRLATSMGSAVGQPLPAGAYMRSHVIGYRIVKKSPDEVSAWILAKVVQKNGETVAEQASYQRDLVAVQWVDGDWKLTVAASQRSRQDVQGHAKPTMGAPGDAVFNAAGWTAIRGAS
ncbi:hypothetical protein [Streptomyces sp. NPDC057494]|uniref:hypothetical protein n=1 Tax=Streptomyces sp. NPDC057494 TaxID=3346148 RepID=UPI0036B57BCC